MCAACVHSAFGSVPPVPGYFARIREIRPIAWPNSRMIGFADEILGRQGRLNAALREHYRWQAPRRPEFMEELKRNGRGAEVPE